MTEVAKKNGVKFGIILGAISILTTTAIYSIDPSLFVNIMVGIGIFLVNITIAIIGVATAKKQLKGFISFKDAFTVFFIETALGGLIGTLFMAILFNFIDPSVKEVVMDRSIEMTVGFMEKAGTSTSDMKAMVEKMKETDNFSAFNLLKSYAIGLLFYIIIGLIVAAAFKKSPIQE